MYKIISHHWESILGPLQLKLYNNINITEKPNEQIYKVNYIDMHVSVSNVVGFTTNYLCTQYLSPLTLWDRTLLNARCNRYNLWQVSGFLWVLRFPPPIKLRIGFYQCFQNCLIYTCIWIDTWKLNRFTSISCLTCQGGLTGDDYWWLLVVITDDYCWIYN
jgi:hypothetical protein